MFVSGKRVSKSTVFETDSSKKKPPENFITGAQTEDKASVWQIRKGRVRIHPRISGNY